ncbi:AMP-binding protein [Amycolatopsis azurea]|uniref:AMP-dependent synthetase n=1 Tax=Amycolatopsis azurea DSM 43854 TaxID=1238180 RepID=M2NNI4_9PSEU|nr:AMP-binding protein [Amycolatopsis azurea]EMD23744.1 Long-chain-fatty-acid--CoA ligase [Amycolatopsis azurea DSM 43854]OOC02930.1 AMP-dependent synthetase [Amycolatopsis azurea DSM 43854]
MPELDLASLHEAIAAELGDEPCVIARRVVSWREMTDRTRRLAAVLREHGLGRRAEHVEAWETGQDHLGVLLHNGSEYLEGVLGAHKASVAPFNINYRYTQEELAYLLRDAHPSVLLYAARFAPSLAEVLPQLDHSPLLLQVDDGTPGPLLPGALDYETALAGADPADGAPKTSPADAHLLYTGGTTGMPKGVIWRVGDLVAGPMGVRDRDGSALTDVEQAVRRALAIRGRVLPAPPLMHGAGTGIALGGWLSGATVVIQPRPEHFDAATLLKTCERRHVTSMAIVGDAFGAPLVAELELRPRPLPDLRLIVNSGAALREEIKTRLKELLPQLRITDMLGSSETGLHAKRGSGNRFAGKGNAVVLADDRARLLAPGDDEIGWLAQGGHIPRGYLGDRDKTAATFVTVDETRYSVPGDRARLLADGGIEFFGREATTINTGGEKVFAEEVEQVLRALPGVADALVVGRASERWGQEVVALYQSATEVPPTADELAAGCRERLAGYKVPKEFIRTDKVHRHDNGKADYTWARDAAETRKGGTPACSASAAARTKS